MRSGSTCVLLLATVAGCRCGSDEPGPTTSTAPAASAKTAKDQGAPEPAVPQPTAPPPPWTVRRVEGAAELEEGARLSGLVPVALPAGSQVVLAHRRGPRVTLSGPFAGFVADDGEPLVATVAVARGTVRATVAPAGPAAGRPRVRVAAPGVTVVLPAAGDARVVVAEPEDGPGPPLTRAATLSGIVELRAANEDGHPAGPRRRLPPGADGEHTVPHPAHLHGGWPARAEAALADALTAVQAELQRGAQLSSDHRAVAAGLPPAEPPRDGPSLAGADDGTDREVTRRRARALQLQSELVAHARALLLERERLRFAWERVLVAGVGEAAWAGDAPPLPSPPSAATLAAVRRGLGLAETSDAEGPAPEAAGDATRGGGPPR